MNIVLTTILIKMEKQNKNQGNKTTAKKRG